MYSHTPTHSHTPIHHFMHLAETLRHDTVTHTVSLSFTQTN
jgi:hypothetical protein